MTTVDVGVPSEMASATLDFRDGLRVEVRPHRTRRRGWLVRRILLMVDVSALVGAFAIAQAPWSHPRASGALSSTAEIVAFAASLPLWIVIAKLYSLYDRDEERANHSTVDEFVAVLHFFTVSTWGFFTFSWATGISDPDVKKIVTFWLFGIGFMTMGRAVARAFCRRQPSYRQNTIIVGAGDVGQTVARKFLQHPEYGIRLLGFVDAEPKERRNDLGDLTNLGSPDDLIDIVENHDVERVVFAFSNDSHEETLGLVRALRDANVQIDVVPRLFEIVGPGVEMHAVEGLPLLALRQPRLSRSSQFLKRALDIVLAAFGLLALSPVFLAVAIIIKLDSPGPIFFRQVRRGFKEDTFRIFKFRTMSSDAEERKAEVAHLNMHAEGDCRMFKIPSDPRITRVGEILRRYSIDELPQLLNVVRGEMSLVGPRPLILAEDQFVLEWARERLRIKPGVTGPWQVLGRNHIAFGEMVRLDYIYVTNWSLGNDLKWLFRTLPALLRAEAY